MFQDHIFKLMKNDSYSRYIRSDMYKEFLQGSKKKVIIGLTCCNSRRVLLLNRCSNINMAV